MTYHLQWTADNEEWTKDQVQMIWGTGEESRSTVGVTDMEAQGHLVP